MAMALKIRKKRPLHAAQKAIERAVFETDSEQRDHAPLLSREPRLTLEQAIDRTFKRYEKTFQILADC